jgi:hypothetical protein
MKTKLVLSLAIPALIMLGSAGCVTSTNSYTRDIVYRDGSYYSPADEQYGDYYYEPEPDYSYYDDDYYYGFNHGFNSGYYGNSRYGSRYSSSCRLSYRYDRYCNNGWGNSFLNFGGLTIIFGNSSRYGYGHSYGYGHHNYYGGYPYYGWNSPRPRPHNNDPIPMPKPRRPNNPTPDYGFNNGPGMRVPGEPIRIPTKPGLVDQNPVEPTIEPQDQENLNPYTRTRELRPNIRPEIWRNNRDGNGEEGIVIGNRRPVRPIADETYDPRLRTKPALVIEDNVYQPVEKPIRNNRRPQPYPRFIDSANDARQAPALESSDAAPERVRRDNRQERPEPRVQPARERVERAERSDRPIRSERQKNNDEGNGAD